MARPKFSIFEWVGGEETFYRLANAFYTRIDTEPILRHMFPADLTGPKERLALFLMQYFGGPNTYSERRGHPRLRMRHIPFTIGQAERDAWVGHMLAAIDEVGIQEPVRSHMREYFENSGTFMINTGDPTTTQTA